MRKEVRTGVPHCAVIPRAYHVRQYCQIDLGVTEMSKAGLESFVQKAVGDEAFRRQMKENPEAALAGYDLTADEKAAIKSGDAARLRALGVDERITKSTLWDPTGTGDTKPWG
jgi:hypothetical protein